MVIRRLAVWICAAILAALAASHAASAVFERNNPALAQMLPPANGRATGQLANQMLLAATLANDARMPDVIPPAIPVLARRAFALDPTSVESVRLLALDRASNGDRKAARELMKAALLISKRDVGINIWLSEDAARGGDAAEAFRYYDRTMRVSPSAAATLLPAMANVLRDQRMIEPFAAMLRRDPPWAPDLWSQIVRTPGVIANAARLRIMLAGRKRARDPEIDRQLLAQLVEAEQFSVAVDLYRAVSGAAPAVGPGGFAFTRPPKLPPLDWRTFSDGGYSAVIDPPAGQMLVSVMSGAHGIVARKLMKLAPGSYRLSASVTGLDAAAELVARLRCAGSPDGVAVSEAALVDGESAGTVAASGRDCRYYWLEIEARGPTGGAAAADFAIRRLALEPA